MGLDPALVTAPLGDLARILRWSFRHIGLVWLYEIWDQLVSVRFRRFGPLPQALAAELLPDGMSRPEAGRGRTETSEGRM